MSDRRITVVEADHATWQWFGTLLVARPIPAWHPVIVAMAVRDVVRARVLILGWRA